MRAKFALGVFVAFVVCEARSLGDSMGDSAVLLAQDSTPHSQESRICRDESDKIKGCVEDYVSSGILCKIPYQNGAIEGIQRCYQGGILASETPFKNGKMDGIQRIYADGRLWREMIFDDDSLLVLREYRGDEVSEVIVREGGYMMKIYGGDGLVAIITLDSHGDYRDAKCANGTRFELGASGNLDKLDTIKAHCRREAP